MSRSQVFSAALIVSAALSFAACTGGGGGGGGDDDDDTPPPTPERPGWVAVRWKTPAADQVLSLRILDSTTSLADVALPVGHKSLVTFADPTSAAGDERAVMMVKVAVSSTAGDIYVSGVDGTNPQLAATGVSGVFGWADPTHLVIQKGKDPTQSVTPQRDFYLMPLDGSGEIPLTTDAADEEFGGISGGTIVFRRGPLVGESDLWTVPALGGSPVPLTNDAGAEIFFGITPSGRVVYSGGVPTNFDLFSIPVAGGTRTTLADGASPEIPNSIVGERVIFVENVQPQPDFIEGNVRSVNADGSSLQDLAVTQDVPENPVGVTANGTVLITSQTSFDPVAIDLLAVPIAGGQAVQLGSIVDGGVAAIVGDRIVLSRAGTIVAVDADGGAETDLASDASFEAATASRVLYSLVEGTDEKLYSVSLNGGTGVKLRDATGTDTFKGSVGNVVVLSVAGANGAEDIVAVDSGGGNLRTLAGQADAEQFRALLPDGRVIFSRRRGSFLDDIYVVNHDGTNELPITDRADVDTYLGHLP